VVPLGRGGGVSTARHRQPPPGWWAYAVHTFLRNAPPPGPRCAVLRDEEAAPVVVLDLGEQAGPVARLEAMLRHPAHGTGTAPGRVA
jgi:hypothetical protein